MDTRVTANADGQALKGKKAGLGKRILRTVVFALVALIVLGQIASYVSRNDPGPLKGAWVGGNVLANPDFGWGSARILGRNASVTYLLQGRSADGLQRISVVAETPQGKIGLMTYAILPNGNIREDLDMGSSALKAELRRAN